MISAIKKINKATTTHAYHAPRGARGGASPSSDPPNEDLSEGETHAPVRDERKKKVSERTVRDASYCLSDVHHTVLR